MSSARIPTDPLTLLRAIEQAGSPQAYVEAQLAERGFLVQRRETDRMSERELEAYKKSLKAEAQARRELKAEAWKAYKSSHIVFLGDGVYWNDEAKIDPWDLPNVEVRAAENELPPLDGPRHLAEALELSIKELRWLAFHRDAATRIHYQRFTIPKRDGTERAIWAPMPRLKQAQHWILRNIAEKLLVHGSAHGFLPGRSTLTNAQVHANPRVVLKMDIKDFFPTVTLPRVRGIFRKAGYREQVATLLALLCTESPREIVEHDDKTYYVALGPRCLPQGAPTSPALTNTLCLAMDRRLNALARRLGWRYSRYADDLTFSLPQDHKDKPRLGTLIGLTTRIVQDEGFMIHPSKTRVARSGARQSITGLVVNGSLPPRTPRKLRRQLRAAIHNHRQGKPPYPGESPSTLTGLSAYVYMTDPTLGARFLAELDQAEAASE